MKVAKIRIEAPVVSFRYPHFLIGRQITFDMPPPSTIYGHIVSAVGDWIDPTPLRFAYHFTFKGKGSDLEHQHIITKGKSNFELDGQKYPTSTDAVVQPHYRDFLYDCHLTLYLQPTELAEAFRNPCFCVNFGRSQDLARIVSVEEIELAEAKGAYLESTLLPFSLRKYTGKGITVLMPRYISPPPEREPSFGRYVVLHERLFAGDVDTTKQKLLQYEGDRWWVDPSTQPQEGVHEGIVFHSFVGGEDNV